VGPNLYEEHSHGITKVTSEFFCKKAGLEIVGSLLKIVIDRNRERVFLRLSELLESGASCFVRYVSKAEQLDSETIRVSTSVYVVPVWADLVKIVEYAQTLVEMCRQQKDYGELRGGLKMRRRKKDWELYLQHLERLAMEFAFYRRLVEHMKEQKEDVKCLKLSIR